MEIVSAISDGVYLITLTGKMWSKKDLIAFETAVDEGLILELSSIVINGSNLSFINSQGLGVLTKCNRKAIDAGSQIILFSPNEAVSELIKLSGISMVIPIIRSKEELDKMLK